LYDFLKNIQKCNMGIKKPEFDAEYESVEKLQKDSCKKLSARM
jgi:hypothetical protein